MKRAITIFIGFVHDFAAGCWAATILAVYRLEKNSNENLASLLAEIEKDFFYIGLVMASIVIFAGAGRMFTYVENVYGKNAERLRRKMLICKHIALFVIFASGIYWQYTMAFK